MPKLILSLLWVRRTITDELRRSVLGWVDVRIDDGWMRIDYRTIVRVREASACAEAFPKGNRRTREQSPPTRTRSWSVVMDGCCGEFDYLR
jgi:hypothetical protein